MIDWSKAPEGATHHNGGEEAPEIYWYKANHDGTFDFWDECTSTWLESLNGDTWHSNRLTPRPIAPKPYTRDEALQFLVERLDTWPTDIADAPLCPGWGWTGCAVGGPSVKFVSDTNKLSQVVEYQWQAARPDFQPFVSMEDAATAEQPAPSGKGDPILGMVLADLTNRALEGKKKYGEPLKAHNGRNALWDAYQEALDLCMYLRQAIEESK